MPSLLEHVSKRYKIGKTPHQQPSSKLMVCCMSFITWRVLLGWSIVHGGKPRVKLKHPSLDQAIHEHLTTPTAPAHATPRHQSGVLQPFFGPHVSFSILHTATHTDAKKTNIYFWICMSIILPTLGGWNHSTLQCCFGAVARTTLPFEALSKCLQKYGESWLKYWPEREMVKHVTWNTSKKETGKKHVKTISQT